MKGGILKVGNITCLELDLGVEELQKIVNKASDAACRQHLPAFLAELFRWIIGKVAYQLTLHTATRAGVQGQKV